MGCAVNQHRINHTPAPAPIDRIAKAIRTAVLTVITVIVIVTMALYALGSL